jgi:Co/Zn/Cd efflux system component
MTRSQRLLTVLALNLALVAGLVAAGAVAGSLATAATGGDYLLDAAAVGIALLAAWLAGRPRKRPGRPGRVDPVSAAALINAGWLLALELLVAAAAVTRLAAGTPRVSGLPVLLVSGLAAVVMTAAALILRGADPDPAATGTATCPWPRCCSTPWRTRPRRPGPPWRAGSSWPPAAGTGWTRRWPWSSRWSWPAMRPR